MPASQHVSCLVIGLAALAAASPSFAQSSASFGPINAALSDPCAVYTTVTSDASGNTFTKVEYGEPIDFTINGQTVAVIDTSGSTAHLKFLISAHGDGIGRITGGKYIFNGKLQAKANTTGVVTDPNFRFNGSFKLSARMIGQGNAGSPITQVRQGAQDNAVFDFAVRVNYANGQPSSTFDHVNTKFTLTCMASPWANQMGAVQAGTKTPVGRGFGDVWNKYSWSMQDFKGGLLVGTKNAYYDIARLASYSDTNDTSLAAQCARNPADPTPDIYQTLACAELFEAPAQVGRPATTDTRFAEIWRLDYAKKTWARVRDDTASQGFRIMAVHDNKLYVGSDLGSFVAGVDLNSTGATPGTWNFPGSRLLVSSDGVGFGEVACGASVSGPCNSAMSAALQPVPPDVNISFRALASYGGKLYVGTFNTRGGELWSYVPGQPGTWTQVKKFAPTQPAVTELAVFNAKLYVGLAGVDADYLYVHDGSTTTAVPSLPAPSATAIGVLKLFASSKGLLYVGSVDLVQGFSLVAMNTSGGFQAVTQSGFGNASNGYPWSMAEINGRLFLGTFNTGFLNNLPRGSAELWYSDDSMNWQQMALPLDFGYLNYGIRTLSLANKQLYLGTASVIIAPDLVTQPVPLSPGTEVWTIRSTTATR